MALKLLNNCKDMDQETRQIALLEDLLRHEGWKLYEANIVANIDLVKECIIGKRDAEGDTLTDKQVDGLRERLGYLEELRETPKNMIGVIKGQKQQPLPEDDSDPFAKSIKELFP